MQVGSSPCAIITRSATRVVVCHGVPACPERAVSGQPARRQSVQLAPWTPWTPTACLCLPDAGLHGLALPGHVWGAGRAYRAGTQLAGRIVGLGWRGG